MAWFDEFGCEAGVGVSSDGKSIGSSLCGEFEVIDQAGELGDRRVGGGGEPLDFADMFFWTGRPWVSGVV